LIWLLSGKHNIYKLSENYPTKTDFKILNVPGEGRLWITELNVTYDDGRAVNGMAIMEFRDNKVAHETLYSADPFEPHE